MLKVGLVSVSFRNHSPKEIIKAVKEAGLNAIEWGSDIHAPCNATDRLNQIAQLQKSNGIKCSSYGTYFNLDTNKAEEITQYIAAAKILGTNILRIWCGNKASKEYSALEKKKLFEQAKNVTKTAKENNATLCLEFHPDTFSDCLESALHIIKFVNSPNFKMYWQPNQFKSFNENMLEADGLSAYVENIHVFNWNGSKRNPLSNALKEWKAYATLFSKEHYMLLEFMPDDKIESLKKEAEALTQIIGEQI